MADLRTGVRAAYWEKGFLCSRKTDKAKPNSKYENYFAHHEKIAGLRDPAHSHRYLAVRRGVAEGELALVARRRSRGRGLRRGASCGPSSSAACTVPDSPGADLLLRAARRSLKEHVAPQHRERGAPRLKDAADEAAIRVFAENVRRVLLASPFGPKAVLAVDPGLRTGCKLAVVDASGAYVASDVIQLQSEEGKAKGKERLLALVRESNAQAVAVGNGTAGRETEAFVRAVAQGAGRRRAGRAGERGRRQRLQRERGRPRGVPRPRRDRARRDLHRPAAPGPAGRARQDRAQEHRRGPVPARRVRPSAQAEPRRRSSTPASTRSASTSTPPRRPCSRTSRVSARRSRRPSSSIAQEQGPLHVARGAPGRRPLQRQGLRAGGRLPAHARRRPPARQHRRPSRALRAPRGAGGRPRQAGGRAARSRRRAGATGRRCARRSAPSPSTTS